jgi:hypothetical protein
VLVLVGGLAAVGSLRSSGTDSVVPASVVGIDVPREVALLGFPYELDDTRTLAGDDRLELDEGQAVTLVGTELGSGSATLLRDGQPVARVRTGDPQSAPLPIGGPETLRVRLDGAPDGARAGVAVYEATGELAPGVDNGQAVFRESYAGQPLLGAAFSAPGESSVELTADGAGLMRFVGYCDGPDDLFLTVEVDGEPALALGCGGARRDATAGTSGTVPGLGDGPHEVSAFLTHDGEGQAVEADDVTLGLGVYREVYAAEQMGQGVPAQVEYAGRTWRFDHGSGRSTGLTEPVVWSPDASESDQLLAYVVRGRMVGISWKGDLGRGGGDTVDADSTVSGIAGVLVGGDSYQVTVDGDGSARSALLVYRPE